MKNKIPVISTIILFLCLLTQTAVAVGIPDAFRQWGAGIAANGQSTSATFALGATADKGKSFPVAFTAEQKIDVLADFRPSAAHVGKNAAIYLLARYNATWYMKNAANQWVEWNGELASLVANGPACPLKALETLAVQLKLSGLQGNFEIYVGYKLDDVIYYNRKPLSFVVNKTPQNQFPLVNVGSDTSYDEGIQVTLDGSKSRDPDGKIVKYQWEQLTGPMVYQIYFDNRANAVVTLPYVDSEQTLQFKLSVTDNQGAVASAIVKITVRDVPIQLLPEPSCTAPQILQNGVCVTLTPLNGKAIDDPLVGATISAFMPGASTLLGTTLTQADGSYSLAEIPDQTAYYLVSTGGTLGGQAFTGSLKTLCLLVQKSICHLTPYSTLLLALTELYSGIDSERLAAAQQQLTQILGVSSDPFIRADQGQPVADVDLAAWRQSLNNGATLDSWVQAVNTDLSDGKLNNAALLSIFKNGQLSCVAPQILHNNTCINTYTLSYSAGANGSITGSASQTVNHGASGSAVTAIPAAGYYFSSWSDGVTTAIRTDANVTSNLNVSASFAMIQVLNDTGITQCASNSTNGFSCPLSGYPGQDAEFGRDKTHNDPSDGHAGFSFTKISSIGQALAIQNVAWSPTGSESAGSQWSCVKDKVTGLLWEVKTDDNGLHDKDWLYTWYEPDNSKNGGHAGYENGGNCGGTSVCNTAAYLAAVNAAGWCGYTSGWRLPTIDELAGIASLDRLNPAIDTLYFRHTKSAGYWSSSPGAYHSSGVLFVHFTSGGFGQDLKYASHFVRLVRSGV